MYYFDMEKSQTSQMFQPLIRQFTAIHGPLYYLFKNFFHLLYSLLKILFEYFVHFCVSSRSLTASCRLHLFQFLWSEGGGRQLLLPVVSFAARNSSQRVKETLSCDTKLIEFYLFLSNFICLRWNFGTWCEAWSVKSCCNVATIIIFWVQVVQGHRVY